MRNVFVMHSFCELAHAEIGFKSFEISLTDFDKDIKEIDVRTRDNVLTPAQMRNLLLSSSCLNISKRLFTNKDTYSLEIELFKLSFENKRELKKSSL